MRWLQTLRFDAIRQLQAYTAEPAVMTVAAMADSSLFVHYFKNRVVLHQKCNNVIAKS